ncbi:hypothetical protein LPJ61_001289, partial [Coemansia biformis]
MLRMLMLSPVALLWLLLLLLAVHPARGQQGSACAEGSRQCQAQDKTSPFYYKCAGGQWSLYTCGNGYTCSSSGGSGAVCVSNSPPPPACVDGQRRCVSTNKNLYYHCSGGAWTLYTCGNGYQCSQTSPLQATCTPTAPQCASGSQRCVGSQSPSLYFACTGGTWNLKSCNTGDRCIDIPDGTVNCQVGGARKSGR